MSKILIATGIYAPEIGGPASYCETLATRLAQNHSVTVLTYSKTRSFSDDKTKPYQVVRVWKKYPWFIRHVIYLIRAYILAGKHDTVYALNAVSAGWPAMRAAKSRNKNFFVKIVGDYAWEIAAQNGKTPYLINDFQAQSHSGWIKRLHQTQISVARQADGVIVPSNYLAQLVAGWGIDNSKIKVVYNGVNFKPSQLAKEEARKEIGIPGIILVSAGRLVSWKGFKMLIKIMPQLFQINQYFRLIIIGDGPDKQLLQAMVKNMGLSNKVYIVGKKDADQMAKYFAAADIFILNSGYEGFSHQLLEVMHCGVPVVASAVGGNREVIKQGQNGFLVKYNDEFNIIEAIKGLWKIQELRDQFIDGGYQTVKRFSVDQMINDTIDVILGNDRSDLTIQDDHMDADVPDVTQIISNNEQ